jgi:hypothetical protein
MRVVHSVYTQPLQTRSGVSHCCNTLKHLLPTGNTNQTNDQRPSEMAGEGMPYMVTCVAPPRHPTPVYRTPTTSTASKVASCNKAAATLVVRLPHANKCWLCA